MCRYALLRIKKTDTTGLIIPYPTHLSGADLRTKKFIEVIETFMHRGYRRRFGDLVSILICGS